MSSSFSLESVVSPFPDFFLDFSSLFVACFLFLESEVGVTVLDEFVCLFASAKRSASSMFGVIFFLFFSLGYQLPSACCAPYQHDDVNVALLLLFLIFVHGTSGGVYAARFKTIMRSIISSYDRRVETFLSSNPSCVARAVHKKSHSSGVNPILIISMVCFCEGIFCCHLITFAADLITLPIESLILPGPIAL